MKKLVVLISNKGTGTNLQAIIDGIEQKKINARIIAVISDAEDAQGLQRAIKHNLQIEICPKKEDLLPILQKLNPNYICLAGWKQFLTSELINIYENKILNLHPGLLPDTIDGVVKNPDGTNALWNKKMFADKALQNFLETKSTYAGSSIHFITHEVDFGPVLGRCFEKINDSDTIDTLYQRLKQKENKLYVDVLAKLCN